MRTDFPSPPSISTADDSTTDPISGIDSPCMTKAALYARVSTDAQQKEGTIESQLVELRRQISATGRVLAAEYIDDGYTGTLLDRPALNRMRADLKTDRFDRIYFLAADRIARDIEYQRIIVGELLKHGTDHAGGLFGVRASQDHRAHNARAAPPAAHGRDEQ